MIKNSQKYDIIIINEEARCIDFKLGEFDTKVTYESLDQNCDDLFDSEFTQKIDSHCKSSRNTILAIPDSWCMSVTLDTSMVPRWHRSKALNFLMEDKLPIPSEDFVSDSIQSGTNGHVLGLACKIDRLTNVLDTIENVGLTINHICPTALISLQHVLEKNRDNDAVLINDGSYFHLFLLEDNKPSYWVRINNHIGELQLQIVYALSMRKNKMRLLGVNVPEDIAIDLRGIPGLSLICNDDSTIVTDDSILFEKTCSIDERPWVNLRKGKLVSKKVRFIKEKPMMLLCASIFFLLISLNVIFMYRTGHYQTGIELAEKKQLEVYKKVFASDSGTPDNVIVSLQNEYDNTAVVKQGSTLPFNTSALLVLYEILNCLPKDVRFRIRELRVEPEKIRIEGEALNHGIASAIAKALEGNPCFQVEMPKTQKLKDEGVRFTVDMAYSKT